MISSFKMEPAFGWGGSCIGFKGCISNVQCKYRPENQFPQKIHLPQETDMPSISKIEAGYSELDALLRSFDFSCQNSSQ